MKFARITLDVGVPDDWTENDLDRVSREWDRFDMTRRLAASAQADLRRIISIGMDVTATEDLGGEDSGGEQRRSSLLLTIVGLLFVIAGHYEVML